MIYAVGFFVLGFVLASALTPWAMRLSRRGIGLDDPNETRKTQEAAISRLGGLPIMLAVTAGLAVILSMQPEHSTKWLPIMVGSLLMYGIGFWDDLKRLAARKKLAGQILTACLVYWMGLAIDKVTYPGGGWSVDLTGGTSFAVTVFWLIAVPNVINLIDGFDGLAGGLGVFMSITLGVVAVGHQRKCPRERRLVHSQKPWPS